MVAGGSGCRGRGSAELFIGRRGARISEQKEDMDFSRLGASSSSKAGFPAAAGGRGSEAGSRGGVAWPGKGSRGGEVAAETLCVARGVGAGRSAGEEIAAVAKRR